jgi:Ca-activated chloride channel family protein
MLNEFHLIRPYWLLALLPVIGFAWTALRQRAFSSAWDEVCDPHLLPYLIQTKASGKRQWSWFLLLASVVFIIISLCGPSWSRFPVPTYQAIQPRVLILDMSDSMLAKDVQPDRLSRAKFKLHDLLMRRREGGQYGLVVYTGEPFVASPLTDDSQTIDALLPMLSPDVMPVAGHRLDSAMNEAASLLSQAGFLQGHLLVLTARAPTTEDIDAAKALDDKGIHVSIMPVLSQQSALNPLFLRLAQAGGGHLIPMTDTNDDLKRWLSVSQTHKVFNTDLDNEVPVWRDQGRYFIIPALLCLLPVFRRGWLQRVAL